MRLEIDSEARCADFIPMNEISITEQFRLDDSDRKLTSNADGQRGPEAVSTSGDDPQASQR